MKVVSLVDLRRDIGRVIAGLRKFGRVEITKRNVPIAVLLPYESAPENRTELGRGRDSVRILGDLTEPLIPEGDWEMLKP